MEFILYGKELILFHDSMAKNGEKESILDSQESESTQSYLRGKLWESQFTMVGGDS